MGGLGTPKMHSGLWNHPMHSKSTGIALCARKPPSLCIVEVMRMQSRILNNISETEYYDSFLADSYVRPACPVPPVSLSLLPVPSARPIRPCQIPKYP